jgi:hypothetical protein
MSFIKKSAAATVVILSSLITFYPAVKADNTAINQQYSEQTGAAVGIGNRVNNSIRQRSFQGQRSSFGSGNNAASSTMFGSQTGVADGVGNRVRNSMGQVNRQQQNTRFGSGNNVGITEMGSGQTGGGDRWF